MQKKWEDLFPEDEIETETPTELLTERESFARNNFGRLKGGMRTREPEFRLPILKVLDEKGGSASMKVVIDELEHRMKKVLKDVDYDPLPSDPDTIRWRNTAQWSRQALVNEGLMKNNSPRGTWEISDKGRKYLEANKQGGGFI